MRVSGFWYAFLLIWAFTHLVYGAVAPWALAAATAALAILTLLAHRLLPGPAGLSRAGVIFLAAVAGVFALQLLPIPWLYPHATALRKAHGVGSWWPATADAFWTTRALALTAAYAMAALFVHRLRQAGLSSERMLKGVCVVLALQGLYALVQVFGGLQEIPFFGERVSRDASGTLVNRNSFAGMMAMGLAVAAGLAIARFTWPARPGRRMEAGLPWTLAAALFATGLVLSSSRGGVIAAATGLAVMPFLLRGRFSAAGTILLVVLGATAVIAANPTVLAARFEQIDPYDLTENSRWDIWATTAEGALRQPVLGYGIGTHPQAYHPFQPPRLPNQMNHAHNEYLNAFFEGGAVWLALLAGGLAFWFIHARRVSRLAHGPDRILSAGVLAGVFALGVHSFVDFDLQVTAVGLLFAILIGVATPRPRSPGRAAVFPVVALVGLAASAALAFAPLDPSKARTEAECRLALGLSPYDHRAAWFYARAAEERNDLTEAGRRFEIAADLWPARPDLQRDAGLWFWEGGQVDLAAKCLRRLFEQSPSAVGEVMAQIWEPSRATADHERLLPADPRAAAEMAGYLTARGRWQEGMELFDRHSPGEPGAAPAYDRFADALERAGQWGLEASVRERRLKMKSDADAFAAAARAWSRLGLYEQAADRASMAARLDPVNAAWRALLGDVRRAKGEWTGAMEAYTEALRIAPFDLSHRLRRAELCLESKMWDAAASDLREILRSRPNDGSIVLKLARALDGSGNRDAALAALQDYLSGHPDDAAVRAMRDKLSAR